MTTARSTLLIVDVQAAAFQPHPGLEPMPDGERLIDACQRLVRRARARGDQVIWIQHDGGAGDPFALDAPGHAIDPRLDPAPQDARVLKRERSAFSNPALEPLLAGSAQVLVAGLQSECCVRSTLLAGQALGLPMALVQDAHQSWPSEGREAEGWREAVNAEMQAAGIPLHRLAELGA